MNPEFEDEFGRRMPGVIARPEPNEFIPSRFGGQEERSPNGQGQQRVSVSQKAARGDYNIYTFVCDATERQKIVASDARRCYLEIQNKSGSRVRVSFGSGQEFIIEPLGTWWSMVAPVNEIWVRGTVGGEQCSILTATDL